MSQDSFIPLSVPQLGGNEWTYLKDCLDSGWVSSVGSYVERFEKDVAQFVGAPHGVATASGTAALHLALLIAGVKPGDLVITPTLTFIAPVNTLHYVGAAPVFIDAEPDFIQADTKQIAAFLETQCEAGPKGLRHKPSQRRVSAIMVVHLLGHPVDLDEINRLARHYHLAVIEDTTESLGARYKGAPLGQHASLACLSFNGNKIMTTGGGGMIVTSDPQFAAKSRYLSTQAKDDPLEYIHHEIGFNYRMTNIQAALGCAQLEQLPHFVERRRAVAQRYQRELNGVAGLRIVGEAKWATSTFWLSTLVCEGATFAQTRELIHFLQQRKIQARPLWQPIHLSPAHAGEQIACPCPVAERLYASAVNLPSSSPLTESEQSRVIDAVKEFSKRR
jgi:perosamine synthetase